MNNIYLLLGATVGVSLGACTMPMDSEVPSEVPQGPPTFRERLSGRETLAVELAPAAVELNAIGRGTTATVAVDVMGGEVTVRATETGELWVEGLALDLAEVTLPADLVPPEGARLTDLHVALERVAGGAAAWEADGSRVLLEGDADLVVDWTVRFADGEPHALAPIRVREVGFVLTVEQSADGSVAATLAGGRAGVLWSWAGWFELSDLALEVTAREGASAAGS
jgi:hypothetical protein